MKGKRMDWKFFFLLAVIITLTLTSQDMFGAEPPYYQDKTIRIVVGYSPGGGFDTHARLLARHIGKHIPGHPTVYVENMTGAGGTIAANYINRVAKPDGLTIGTFSGAMLATGQLLGRPGPQFDLEKFEWIGCPISETNVGATTRASGITSMEKFMSSKKLVKIGAASPDLADFPKLLKYAIGLPVQVIEGYKGTAEVRLAAESGEVDGMFNNWASMKATWRTALEVGDAIVVLQLADRPIPDHPNVPLAIDFAKTEEARIIIKVYIHRMPRITNTYTFSPGTPKERVQILRNAFQEVVKDKELLADAEKAKLTMNLVTGEEVEAVIRDLKNLNPAIVEKLKEILLPKK